MRYIPIINGKLQINNIIEAETYEQARVDAFMASEIIIDVNDNYDVILVDDVIEESRDLAVLKDTGWKRWN